MALFIQWKEQSLSAKSLTTSWDMHCNSWSYSDGTFDGGGADGGISAFEGRAICVLWGSPICPMWLGGRLLCGLTCKRSTCLWSIMVYATVYKTDLPTILGLAFFMGCRMLWPCHRHFRSKLHQILCDRKSWSTLKGEAQAIEKLCHVHSWYQLCEDWYVIPAPMVVVLWKNQRSGLNNHMHKVKFSITNLRSTSHCCKSVPGMHNGGKGDVRLILSLFTKSRAGSVPGTPIDCP